MTEQPSARARDLLATPGLALFLGIRGLIALCTQLTSVAVGWHVYDLTRDPFDLGLVGLAQFTPALLLVLVTGAVADRFDRRRVVTVCAGLQAVCVLVLLTLTLSGSGQTWPIFATLAAFGVARAFMGPASSALLPNLVPPRDLAGALALGSSTFQGAMILGPLAGGLLYGAGPAVAFGTGSSLLALATGLALLIPKTGQAVGATSTVADAAGGRLRNLLAGLSYIRDNRIVLGAISLDLFAVLLGGATALLPIYARDVLHTGPWALGLLRAAPATGAIVMGLWLVRHPLRDHAGRWMFISVGLFGAFTAVFGLSVLAPLSVAALAIVGAADMVSVYVRSTLVQLATPDAVRGRVSAVNQVFIGASNELGEFRAGVSATLFGATAAVAMGGVASVAIAALWAFGFRNCAESDGWTSRYCRPHPSAQRRSQW